MENTKQEVVVYKTAVLYGRNSFGRIDVVRVKNSTEKERMQKFGFSRIEDVRASEKVWS